MWRVCLGVMSLRGWREEDEREEERKRGNEKVKGWIGQFLQSTTVYFLDQLAGWHVSHESGQRDQIQLHRPTDFTW